MLVRDGELLRLVRPGGVAIELTVDEAWDVQSALRVELCGRELPRDPAMRVFREVVVRGRTMRHVVSRHVGFWESVASSAWEPQTFAVLERFVGADTVYVDVGAWIGPTVLFAGQRAARTLAFEPDPMAFPELEVNCEANRGRLGEVTLLRQAIAGQAGRCRLTGQGEGGNSNSSLLLTDGAVSWEVEATTLEAVLGSLGPVDHLFVKVDIEGGEYEIRPSLQRLATDPRCTLFVSMHPFRLAMEMRARARRRGGPRRTWAVRSMLEHFRLVMALPARRVHLPDGRRISRLQMLLDPWVRQVVVTHHGWNDPPAGDACFRASAVAAAARW